MLRIQTLTLRTLIRRAAFDLTGLPPEPELARTFLEDPDSDEIAFSKVVDRLLESRHYGKRMSQHWLDVVRSADSSGFANDYERGNSWGYRDYVIRAFNLSTQARTSPVWFSTLRSANKASLPCWDSVSITPADFADPHNKLRRQFADSAENLPNSPE